MIEIAAEIDQYLERLFPICRSITGPGNRESLSILKEIVPLEIMEYPSGTPVYDWVIPEEWIVRDAWIKDAKGNKIVDFQASNIHLVGYSEPIHQKMAFVELKEHLYYRDDFPEAIPYRTTYYKRDWGFCVTKAQFETLEHAEGPLEVLVDSEFKKDGSLSVGELLIPGVSGEEILISTYICHPSMANDNLSGMLLTAFLARELMSRTDLHYTYRIIFVPETIGAISYCAYHEAAMKQIDIGLVITTVGGPGQFGYKQSFNKNHLINRLIEEVFAEASVDYITYPFDIHGSDERQYSSQAFRINTATISRDRYYEYIFYHTSLDNLEFVTATQINETFNLYVSLINKLEKVRIYRNLHPHCEVMLSRYGLYPTTGGALLPENGGRSELDLILWIMFLCDGTKSLNCIAKSLAVDEIVLRPIVDRLILAGILEAC